MAKNAERPSEAREPITEPAPTKEQAGAPSDKVARARNESRDLVEKAVEAQEKHGAAAPWRPEWERLPALHMADVRNALKALSTIALPPLAIPTLGGIAAVKWAKGKLPGQGGSSVREAIRSTMSPKEMGRGVLGVLKYPFQLGKSLTKNALVLGHRILSPPVRLLKFIGREIYVDTREVIETLAGLQPKAEGQINVVAGGLGLIGRGIGKAWNAIWTHPKTVLVAAAVIGGYIASAPTIASGLGSLGQDIVGIAKWAIAKIAGQGAEGVVIPAVLP